MGCLLGAIWSLLFCAIPILVCGLTKSSPDFHHESMPVDTSSASKINKKSGNNTWLFNIEDMRSGSKTPILFPRKEDAINGRFIPRETADSIPFSKKDLPKILDMFGFTRGSKSAANVESALQSCEKPPASEVFKACFTSFEAMRETMFRFFNIDLDDDDDQVSGHSRISSSHPRFMTTVFRGPHETDFQNYTILESPREVPTRGMVGCHQMRYPFAVYYCHVQPGETKVYRIPLLGERDGVRVDALAVCHLDTSQWDPHGWAFVTLGNKLGDPVCHFFPPYDNLVWVHTLPVKKAYY